MAQLGHEALILVKHPSSKHTDKNAPTESPDQLHLATARLTKLRRFVSFRFRVNPRLFGFEKPVDFCDYVVYGMAKLLRLNTLFFVTEHFGVKPETAWL